jgi:hypothetical protein
MQLHGSVHGEAGVWTNTNSNINKASQKIEFVAGLVKSGITEESASGHVIDQFARNNGCYDYNNSSYLFILSLNLTDPGEIDSSYAMKAKLPRGYNLSHPQDQQHRVQKNVTNCLFLFLESVRPWCVQHEYRFIYLLIPSSWQGRCGDKFT